MPNTYACYLVSNPNVPIFLPRVCTLVLFISLASFPSSSYLVHVILCILLLISLLLLYALINAERAFLGCVYTVAFLL